MSRSSAILSRVLGTDRPRIGPFRLLRPLGAGGFAPVYLATEAYGEIELRTVAVKLFAIDADEREHGGSTGTGTLRATRDRILEEARALCRVEHPNVVRFLQIAQDETGCVFGLAMEHVQGRSLADRIDSQKVLSVDATLEVGAAIASALAAVHDVGLVHRDVKPPNIIEASGVYKLIDFGIASTARVEHHVRVNVARPVLLPVAVGETLPASDVDGSTEAHGAGTPGYIDPVCLSSMEPADASSDLYGLGATLYECLSGRLPASLGPGPLVSRYRSDVMAGAAPPPPLREVAPIVPEEVARLVDALVSPKREDRPRRAAWVAVEIERLRRAVRGRSRALPEDGPFRGLARFEERHRDVYFGRAVEVATALEMLRTHGLVALVGPSGSGKSSLARSGVVPAIMDGALGTWPPVFRAAVLSPGTDPRSALAVALGMAELPDDPHSLASVLAARVESEGVGLAIVVDQLEEIVTLSDSGGAAYIASFLTRIGQIPLPGLRALVTARRDLLDPLLAVPELGPALVRGTQLVAPLGRAAWISVLEDGLAAYGYALENDAMREELARELGVTAESMPLVAFALTALWAERDMARKIVPRAALAKLGGVGGALERHAEDTLAQIAAAFGRGAAEVARSVLVSLTTVRGTRARRSIVELTRETNDPRVGPVIEALARARLVVAEDGRYSIAHEALLTQWRTLRGFIDMLREDRALAAEIEEAASSWTRSEERERLWRGRRLGAARQLGKRGGVPLSNEARAFLSAFRRADVRGRTGVIALMVLFVAGGPTMCWSYQSAESQTLAEKRDAMEFVQEIARARDTPEVKRARAIEELHKSKAACEHEVERLRALYEDAGLPDTGPPPNQAQRR